MSTLVMFLVAGVGTYMIRSSMVMAGGRAAAAAWIEERLSLVGPAVLAAIVAGALFVHDGTFASPGIVEVATVLIAVAAVRRTQSVGMALAAGLPIFWIGVALGLA